MTVASEACGPVDYTLTTSVPSNFSPGFSAAVAADVRVTWTPNDGAPVTLTLNTHYGVAINAGSGLVTVTPIALPPLPGTLRIDRRTLAVQSVDFQNLRAFDSKVHGALHDAAARRDAEMRRDITSARADIDASLDFLHTVGDGSFEDVIEKIAIYRGYDTLAAAVGARIPVDVDIITTRGRFSIIDNGGASYSRIAPTTPALWRWQNALDGQWWALLDRVVTPEMFHPGGADYTATFQAIASWINGYAPTGVRVEMSPGVDYAIWPAGTTPSILVPLAGVRNVTWIFHGARFVTNNLFSPNGSPIVFLLTGCYHLTFDSPSYSQSAYTTLDAVTGGQLFYNESGTSDIRVEKLVQNGGQFGFRCSALDANGVLQESSMSGFIIDHAAFGNVYYPLSFQAAGDGFRGRNITGLNCGRLYFPWNVSDHDVDLTSNGGGVFNNVLLKCYAVPQLSAARNRLSKIAVKYRNIGRVNAVRSSSLIALSISQFVDMPIIVDAANNGSGLLRVTVNSTANLATGQIWYANGFGGLTGINGKIFVVTVVDGTHIDLQGSTGFTGTYTSGGYVNVTASIDDITIRVNVDNTSNQQPPAMVTYKLLADSSPDTSVRGYSIKNVEFGGTLQNYNYGIPAIDIFRNATPVYPADQSLGDFAGEFIKNIVLRNLSVSGSDTAIHTDASKLTSWLTLENVYADPNIVWNTVGGVVRGINTNANSLLDARTAAPIVAVANQFVTGMGADGQFLRAQPTVSNISGVDTDGTLATNSDTRVATQKATKTYVDAIVAATDAMVFKGTIDCSGNPNYPAADRGWTYRVSVAGKIGGPSGINVEAGDIFICLTDGTTSGNQATVGTAWTVVQTNLDGAVIGPASAVDATPAVFDGVTGKLIKNITYAAFKTALALVKGDVGLGNIDNTSDASKPVSTAQATSIATKLALAGGTMTGVIVLPGNPSNALEAAPKQYVDATVNALIGANDVEVFKGTIDCSGNPNYPAADAGHAYRVSVAGKIGGASGVNVDIGDRLQCTVDSTASGNQATVGANWWITQANIDGAVVGPAASTSGNVATFSGTSGKVVQDGGKALPSGAILGTSDTQSVAGKTLDNSNTVTLKDTLFTLQDDGDTTKQARFQLSGVTTATLRTYTLPNADTTLVGTNSAGATTPLGLAKTAAAGTSLNYAREDHVHPGRETLTAARTYYVRSDGSDSNTGIVNSAGGAFLTINAAINAVAALDLSIYQATIQIGDGTYTGALVLKPYVGALPPIIQGNNGTPANVLISVTSAIAISNLGAGIWQVNDLKVTTTTSGNALSATLGGTIRFQNLDFGACAAFQIFAGPSSSIVATGNYAVSGNATRHIAANGFIDVSARTITYSNSPVFSASNMLAGRGGVIDAFSMTFTNGGTVTGTRYSTIHNGVIFTNAGGASYIPGDVAGSTATGGQYV